MKSKLITLIAIFLLTSLLSPALSVRGSTLQDHSKIKKLSAFTILGVLDLRTEKDYSAKVKYRTLNHEGGMKVRVLEILKSDVQNNEKGKWLYVLLTAPMWVDSGE